MMLNPIARLVQPLRRAQLQAGLALSGAQSVAHDPIGQNLRENLRFCARAVDHVERHADTAEFLEVRAQSLISPRPVAFQINGIRLTQQPGEAIAAQHQALIDLAADAPVSRDVDENGPAFRPQLGQAIRRERL